MNWRVALFEPDLGDEEIAAITEVIRSRWLTMGERTQAFEAAIAQNCGARHGIAVSNCTTGLHLAMLGLGVGPGTEVIVPSLTFVATANAVRYCGATPVFADVHSLEDWNISRDTIEPLLTPRTRAICVVHYAGYVCDMAPIAALARERGLALIEDVAHAPGASRDGRGAGNWGDAGCFSFFSNKNMTTGEGGMITTSRDDLAESLRRLRAHGMTTVTLDRHKGHAFSYDVLGLGYNFRMTEITAALGLVQLRHLRDRNGRRRELVEHYRRRLAQIPGISVPFADHPSESAFHIMPVLLSAGASRLHVMQGLRERGIQSSIHYRPVDTFTSYREAGLGPLDRLERTHLIGERELTLPLYPSMRTDDVELVCAALAEVV